MVESRSEFFGAAAVALIEADDVETGEPGFFGRSPRVTGIAGTFEAVDDDESWVRLRSRLPVAVAADVRAGLGGEIAGDARAEAGCAPRPEAGSDGHCVAVAEQAERAEFLHFYYGMRGMETVQRWLKLPEGAERHARTAPKGGVIRAA